MPDQGETQRDTHRHTQTETHTQAHRESPLAQTRSIKDAWGTYTESAHPRCILTPALTAHHTRLVSRAVAGRWVRIRRACAVRRFGPVRVPEVVHLTGRTWGAPLAVSWDRRPRHDNILVVVPWAHARNAVRTRCAAGDNAAIATARPACLGPRHRSRNWICDVHLAARRTPSL